MELVYKDLKKGELKLKVNNLDDLWLLSQIIEEDDFVLGKTFRKIKLGQEPNVKIVKKPVILEIKVEKVDFNASSSSLRVSGIVNEEKEDIPKGSHHTITVEENSVIKITKKEWLNYQLSKIDEALKPKRGNILICILDRSQVGFAILKGYGYEWITDFEGEVEKKGEGFERIKGEEFYPKIVEMLEEYSNRYSSEQIIVASPSFWKETLLNIIKKKNPLLAKKVILATCSSITKSAINEILKRDEVKTALKNERVVTEINLVEKLLEEIGKGNGLGAYGFKEVKQAAEYGAISILLVSDNIIQEYREEGKYKMLEEAMKIVEKAKGEVHIISSEHEGGKKLNNLGSIGAILRYRIG